LSYNNKTPVESSKFVDTFNELEKMFGGCSAEVSPIFGSWIDPTSSITYRDKNRIYHVICDKTAFNMELICSYKEKLKCIFEQEDIFMYSITVYEL